MQAFPAIRWSLYWRCLQMLKGSTEFSKIILACGFTDIRRGVDGLAAIARLHYDLDTTEAGTLFLFCGRKRDRIKGLIWEGDGYVLVYKRLVNGFYHWPRDTEEAKLISQEQFDMFMNGFTIESSIKTIPKKQ